MEAQNEGDEIMLTALRSIECDSLSSDIAKVGQLTPDMLVEAVACSLFLISDGDIKFNKTLPPNVASKHRICTSMCTKIKDIGYPNNIGYNQLLYPTEETTKDLIFWLVQKLPRLEEDAGMCVCVPVCLSMSLCASQCLSLINLLPPHYHSPPLPQPKMH